MNTRTILAALAAITFAAACKEAPSEQSAADEQFKPAGLIQPTSVVAEAPPAPPVKLHADYALLKDPGVIAARCGHEGDQGLIAAITDAHASYTREDYAKSLLATKTAIQSCPDGELVGHIGNCYEQLGIIDKATRYRTAWASEKAGEGSAVDMLPELKGADPDAIQRAQLPKTPEEEGQAESMRELQKLGIVMPTNDSRMQLTAEQKRQLLIQRTQPQKIDLATMQRNLGHSGSVDPRLMRKMEKMQKQQAQEKQ